MSNHTYQAGVASNDITPPSGIRLMGYTVREGFSRGVDEPLTATVLVLQGRGTTVAIIAHDWCVIHLKYATQLRERCARALDLPSSHVMINLSHSHCAPV